MITIAQPVGARPKAINDPADVEVIQQALNEIGPEDGGANPKLKVDGKAGPKTIEAIQKFQLRHFGWKLADGRVDPHGATLIRMNECLGGPSQWKKSLRFQIRRQEPDTTPVRPHFVDVFEVRDPQSMRRAIYALVGSSETELPAVHPSQFQGGWADFRATVPQYVYNLSGAAGVVTTVKTASIGTIFSTSLSVAKSDGVVSGLMHFKTESPKHGYLKLWKVFD